MARYNLAGKQPAVIGRNYGKGKVILSGVHFEDKGEMLLKSIYALKIDSEQAENVAAKLASAEDSRQALFNRIMALTGR